MKIIISCTSTTVQSKDIKCVTVFSQVHITVSHLRTIRFLAFVLQKWLERFIYYHNSSSVPCVKLFKTTRVSRSLERQRSDDDHEWSGGVSSRRMSHTSLRNQSQILPQYLSDMLSATQPPVTHSVITSERSRPLRPCLHRRSWVWWRPNGLLSLHCN